MTISRSRISIFIFALIALLALNFFQITSKAYGADIEITNCMQLQNLDTSAAQDANVILGQNIYCAGIEFESLDWGGPQMPYMGDFNGNGYKIYGLSISAPSDSRIGLFSNTLNATIHDVKFRDAEVTGSAMVGVVVGSGYQTTIHNVEVEGNVTGDSTQIGGIAGSVGDSEISDSSFDGEVSGQSSVGGLAGEISSAQESGSNIFRSFTSGLISSIDGTASAVGGLAGLVTTVAFGSNANFVMSDTYSSANVYSDGANTGGLVGNLTGLNGGPTDISSSTIENSYFSGTVDGVNSVGGIVGVSGEILDGIIMVFNNNFSVGSVTGNVNVGSIIGEFVINSGGPTLSNNYYAPLSTGTPACDGTSLYLSTSPDCYAGGGSGPSAVPYIDESRFIENTTNEPLASWDFEAPIWFTRDAGLPSLTEDDDRDRIDSIEENDAPNDGDLDDNSDPDSTEDNIASFQNITSEYQAVYTSNGELKEVVPGGFSRSGTDFPWGMTSFEIDLSNIGDSANITVMYVTDQDIDTFKAWKLDNDDNLVEIADAIILETNLAGDRVVQVRYTATDGGVNDQDGVANGTILDPMGLGFAPAVVTTTTTPSTVIPAPGVNSAVGELSQTGAAIWPRVLWAVLFIGFGLFVSFYFRKSRSV